MPTQRRQLVFHVPIFRKSVKMAETANNPHPKIPETSTIRQQEISVTFISSIKMGKYIVSLMYHTKVPQKEQGVKHFVAMTG